MNNEKIIQKIVSIIGLFLVIVAAIVTVLKSNSDDKKINEEFPLLTVEDNLNLMVSKRHMFTRYLCYTVYVTLSDGSKNCIHCRTNPNNSDLCIYDILQKGDKVVKKNMNDTIKIIKGESNESYLFLLAD